MIHSGQVRYHDALAPLLQPIGTYTEHPENYNQGDIEEIEASIRKIGMYQPAKVQASTGYICAGNHAHQVCADMGAEVFPYLVLDLTDDEALHLLVSDNYIARRAIPDHHHLQALLEKIEATTGLEGTGTNTHDLQTIRRLNDMPLAYDKPNWPTLTIQMPPHMLKAFRHITREATTDRDRFEVLLRLAGWDGSLP